MVHSNQIVMKIIEVLAIISLFILTSSIIRTSHAHQHNNEDDSSARRRLEALMIKVAELQERVPKLAEKVQQLEANIASQKGRMQNINQLGRRLQESFVRKPSSNVLCQVNFPMEVLGNLAIVNIIRANDVTLTDDGSSQENATVNEVGLIAGSPTYPSDFFL